MKRLVVGGYERVFEISRNFRNEGIDTRHSPEFTTLEAYQAFGDVHDGMDLTERVMVAAARSAAGRLSFTFGDRKVDLTPPWPRHELLDLLEEAVGQRLHPTDDVEPHPGGVRRPPRAVPPRMGLGKADLRALRHGAPTPGLRSRIHLRLPRRGEPAGAAPAGRPRHGRPLPAGGRRQGAGQRLQRAERARGTGGAFPGDVGRGGVGRPRGASGRPHLRRARSSTACPRRRASASASTVWSCSWPR